MGDMLNDVATLLPILHDILEDVRKLTSAPSPTSPTTSTS